MKKYTSAEMKLATMTQAEFGKIIGVSQPHVNRLLRQEKLIRDSDSRKVLVYESLKSFFAAKKSEEPISYARERALHERVKRQRAELQLAKDKGSVYDAAEVDAAIIELVTECRNKFLGLGHKLAMRLENQSAAKCCAIIDEEVYQILTELSAGVADLDFSAED